MLDILSVGQTILPRETDDKGSKKVSVPTNQSAVSAEWTLPSLIPKIHTIFLPWPWFQWHCSKQQEVKYRWHALEYCVDILWFPLKYVNELEDGIRDNLCWIGVRVWCQQDYWSHQTFHASSVLQRNSKITLLGILNLKPREFSWYWHKIHKACLISEWPKE